MDEKSTVYLETTIPSYLTGRSTQEGTVMEPNPMNSDPTIDIADDAIVQEVRKIRQQIFESYDCDIHKFFEGMRQLQETCGHPIYRATSKPENLSASPTAVPTAGSSK